MPTELNAKDQPRSASMIVNTDDLHGSPGMHDRSRSMTSTRLIRLLGVLAVGIAAPATRGELAKPTPPTQRDAVPPVVAAVPGPLRAAFNVPLLDGDRIDRSIQAASQVIANRGASPVELAEARFVLARHGYQMLLPEFFAPPAIGEDFVGRSEHLFQSLRQQAELAVRAIRELDRPSDEQLQFLKEHEERMRRVSHRFLEMRGAGGSGVDAGDMIRLQLMALEARAWLLDAETRLKVDDPEAADSQ